MQVFSDIKAAGKISKKKMDEVRSLWASGWKCYAIDRLRQLIENKKPSRKMIYDGEEVYGMLTCGHYVNDPRLLEGDAASDYRHDKAPWEEYEEHNVTIFKNPFTEEDHQLMLDRWKSEWAPLFSRYIGMRTLHAVNRDEIIEFIRQLKKSKPDLEVDELMPKLAKLVRLGRSPVKTTKLLYQLYREYFGWKTPQKIIASDIAIALASWK